MSHTEHFSDKHFEMIERFRVSRKAIIALRKKYGFNHEEGAAYGCIGILDYIEFGEIDKIMHPNIRKEVQKVTTSEDDPQ